MRLLVPLLTLLLKLLLLVLLPNAGPVSLRVRGAHGGLLSAVLALLPVAAVVSALLVAVLGAMPPAPTVTSGALLLVLLVLVAAVVGACTGSDSECCSGSDNGLCRVLNEGDTPVEVKLELVSSGALAAVDVLQSVV